jgi:CubicO group peptidase (beta-lactamase class C family)
MSIITNERIAAASERAARAGFTGVVRVDVGDNIVHCSAHGMADRAHSIPNTIDTRFAGASALKSCTALTVMSLVQDGLLGLDTPVRSILTERALFVEPAVTVEHLLSHRSGIGEYCHEVGARTADPPQCSIEHPVAILPLMANTPPLAAPGAEFRYNNAGYVLLALIAETVTGTPFTELVDRHVLTPAGMSQSAILSYDELAGDVAIGYLERTGLRTNVHAVPNRGVGDGGLFTTAADVSRFWRALDAGRLVDIDTVKLMTTAHGRTPRGTPYGLGFWLDPTTDAVTIEGYDMGISFRSVHRRSTNVTWTVASNWTDGAWPLADELAVLLSSTDTWA